LPGEAAAKNFSAGKTGETTVNELISLIRSFGIARLGAVIGVTFGVAVALALIVTRIGAPSMSVLYADISYSEAQSVIAQLEQDGVRHDVRDAGNRVSILAPRDQINILRLNLAADGLVSTGGVGYEIFDESNALGVTSFQQNINRLRALEGELARTLSSINGVRSARVHLVMPERQLFSRDRETASASIVVDAPGGLDSRTVRAMVNLTASAVPALDPSKVTILDSAGALLASGGGDDGVNGMAGSIEEKKIAAEARIRRNVEEILGRIVGADNVRVEIASVMDFSRVTESAEIVDPDSQTVLSSTIIEQSNSDIDPNRARGVSVANALPGAQPVDQSGAPATSSSQRTEETTNYEISKTVRNAVREEGLVIKRMSVAVAINGATTIDADGASIFTPRDPEELARLESLVRSTIGFNPARGDQISLIEIPFIALPQAETIAAPAPAPLLSREDMLRGGEVGALAIIALALVFFVLRPMLAPSRAALPSPSISQALPGASQAALPEPSESALDQRIDLAQVEGQVKASSINKVSEIVKAHTDESANILRGWMREAS